MRERALYIIELHLPKSSGLSYLYLGHLLSLESLLLSHPLLLLLLLQHGLLLLSLEFLLVTEPLLLLSHILCL